MRWSSDFLIGLSFFDEQAIVVIAVVCAVIVASLARSAVGVALSVVAGAAVAAVSGRIRLQALAGLSAVQLADNRSYLIRLDAHPGVLDGAPGLLLARSGLPNGVLAQWTIVRGSLLYLISVDRAPAWPQDSPYLQNAFAYMLHSWQWTS